ncbi:hypothetical protein CANCADRAFT_55547 [Tortispora caseinolytica NRRL Y-17796]|uniref:Uncharacterized protein n=1 Tax=Tortispora caseinolytica NRRL Y-17796 TaxID=767744 RepID=A0A1E4TJ88_9ASCO|nr:hypothetical protein CANCADRAFT_55547 [Tortispora caseinolytica NRRL Y-17796]
MTKTDEVPDFGVRQPQTYPKLKIPTSPKVKQPLRSPMHSPGNEIHVPRSKSPQLKHMPSKLFIYGADSSGVSPPPPEKKLNHPRGSPHMQRTPSSKPGTPKLAMAPVMSPSMSKPSSQHNQSIHHNQHSPTANSLRADPFDADLHLQPSSAKRPSDQKSLDRVEPHEKLERKLNSGTGLSSANRERLNRKILDLELSNSSLATLNNSLAKKVRKQQKEIDHLRSLLSSNEVDLPDLDSLNENMSEIDLDNNVIIEDMKRFDEHLNRSLLLSRLMLKYALEALSTDTQQVAIGGRVLEGSDDEEDEEGWYENECDDFNDRITNVSI